MAIKNVEIQDDIGTIYYPHTDASVVRYGDSTVREVLSEYENNIELAAKTIYVATNGNDNLGDGSDIKPYLTINKAISTLKKNIQASIVISLADGIYNEDIIISGFSFYDSGNLIIKSTNGIASNCIIKSVNVLTCSKPVLINNITFNIANAAIYISDMNVEGCTITAASQTELMQIMATTCYISSCIMPNYKQLLQCSASTLFNTNENN